MWKYHETVQGNFLKYLCCNSMFCAQGALRMIDYKTIGSEGKYYWICLDLYVSSCEYHTQCCSYSYSEKCITSFGTIKKHHYSQGGGRTSYSYTSDSQSVFAKPPPSWEEKMFHSPHSLGIMPISIKIV